MAFKDGNDLKLRDKDGRLFSRRAALAGAAGALAALVVLDVFCAWYYNPTAYEWDEYQATDVILSLIHI